MNDREQAWDDYMGDYYRAEGSEHAADAEGERLAFIAGWNARIFHVTTEAEFIAAPIGTVLRDRMGDVFVKTHERGAVQTNVVGIWGPTWVAYPAAALVPTSPDTRPEDS